MHKEREHAHLLRFKEACPFFPEGRIESDEQPDFVVHTRDGSVGIEHTEMFQPGPSHGGSLQAQESLRQRITDRARDLHEQAGGQPLHVAVLFDPRVRIRKQDIQGIARALARFVRKGNVEPDSITQVKRTWETDDTFPKGIVQIQVCRHPGGKQSCWSCLNADYVPPITREDVQGIIERKECKFNVYRAKCPEVWLLIVADSHSAASTIDVTRRAVEYCYETRFDRVFFFWHWDCRFVELRLVEKQEMTGSQFE